MPVPFFTFNTYKMYVANTIKEALFGATPLVAWRQEEDPAKSQLDNEMTIPTSGKYFQGNHPLVTLKNIFANTPKFEDYIYTAYNAATPYVIGNIVLKNSLNWIAIAGTTAVPNTGNDPEAVSSIYWEAYTLDNQKSKWLKQLTQEYIIQVIDDFLDEKKWSKTAKSIIEERVIFDGSQYEGETITSEGRTVGFEIKNTDAFGLLSVLNQIGLQFTQTGTVNINLYHSSQTNAVQTIALTITEANSMQWFTLGWDIEYLSSYDAGGTWTIEYDQSLVSGEAINKAKDWAADPIFGNGVEYSSWKLWSQYLQFHPFIVDTADRKDPKERTYNYTSNYGMNLRVSVYCDYTGLITRQKNLFSSVIAKGVVMRFLREIALNGESRINLSESSSNVSRDEILYELDGNPQGRETGIGLAYRKSLKAIIMDTQGLCKTCLPCGRKGVKYGST